MLVIPAIDLLGGKCVRLAQGDYSRGTVYSDSPGEVAREFEAQGASWLHVVDLDAAKSGKPENLGALQSILAAVTIPVQFGGGVRSLQIARLLLSMGVSWVIAGTVLARERAAALEMIENLGEALVAGIDARDGKVAVQGWTEQAEVEALHLAAQLVELGLKRVILTDIARDGQLAGPNLPFYEAAVKTLPIPVIASGGVASASDIVQLAQLGPEGVIVGKAIYEGRIDLREAIRASREASSSSS
jgi:phosphoribosylformimino-5-aminoimidazole carboxamide ribotide isomerase